MKINDNYLHLMNSVKHGLWFRGRTLTWSIQFFHFTFVETQNTEMIWWCLLWHYFLNRTTSVISWGWRRLTEAGGGCGYLPLQLFQVLPLHIELFQVVHPGHSVDFSQFYSHCCFVTRSVQKLVTKWTTMLEKIQMWETAVLITEVFH